MSCDQDKWPVVGLEGKMHLKELLSPVFGGISFSFLS